MIENIDAGKVKAGYLLKAHGVKGEMNGVLEVEIDLEHIAYFVVKVDGLSVPFFVKEIRETGNRGILVRFEGVETERQMRPLLKSRTLWVDEALVIGDELSEENEDGMVGYTLEDEAFGRLGEIVGVDSQTANVLWIVERSNGEELLVPVAEEYVREVDDERKVIKVHLPDGFVF